MKHFQVVLWKDVDDYQEVRRKFRTAKAAEEYIKKILAEREDIFVADVYDGIGYHLNQYYWNGKEMIPTGSGPHRILMTREDARSLFLDEYGELNWHDVEDAEASPRPEDQQSDGEINRKSFDRLD